MSLIFYYSNYCQNCTSMLKFLATNVKRTDVHYICIDNRVQKPNGNTYIVLNNNQEMILPHTVDKVPALLLLNRGNQVLFGDNIIQHLQPKQPGVQERLVNKEPMAFSFGGMGGLGNCGVSSDNYSFLDQSVEDLSAKGGGGLRQLRNNCTWEQIDSIETPPDDYEPNKIGEVSLEKLQTQRNNEIRNN